MTLALLALLALRSPQQGPALLVDMTKDRHLISSLIYGMNDNGLNEKVGEVDPKFAKEIQLPVSRWGGDATTRYNWKVDGSNSGDDWFYMAGSGQAKPVPSGSADNFVKRAQEAGGIPLLTIPIIDYVNKSTENDCSYPVSIFGPQQRVNPYVHPIVNGQKTDAGNGKKPDGSQIYLTKDQILRIHIPNTPDLQRAWVKHLVEKFGPASAGGVPIYQMDNEPGGWANTHRDVHPQPPTYGEIIEKTIRYAGAVKSADPSAMVLGPGDFGMAVYKGSPEKQGGLWNAELYLKSLHDASGKAGHRLLDYFDEHYYPVPDDGVGPLGLAPAGTSANQKLRLESTRSLWDPAYVEKNWIGKYNGAIRLIPRMKEWITHYYPNTRTAITEYNFGGLESINGALCQADVLGIFGREGLDLATLWGPPKPDQPGAFAFRMYRNYDGHGGQFGDISIKAQSTDQGKLAVYAGERSVGHAITVMVVNKTDEDLASKLTVIGLGIRHVAAVYRYGAADLGTIQRKPDLNLGGPILSVEFPANSITLYVFTP
ncbi:MAG TPA: glycoside hydrolase family 44 protein [Fimbriimonas sp.]|nr:glycoside hydrolase family 44 protein [Fimbriimonas sp.]